MTTLPSCKSWTFTNSGLLIEDWLLKPARPLNLNHALHRLFATDFHNQLPNRIVDQNISYQTIQTILYFSLPLLPAATVLLAIANVFNEAKYYTCPRRTILTSRPYMTQLSQYLIVFFVLTGITSSLTWLAILPRYIPTSIRPPTSEPEQNHSTSKMTPQMHNHSNIPSLENAPHFITQLPALLTMQFVLRLTLCWLCVGLMMNRSSILHSIIVNPADKNLRNHVHHIYLLIQGTQDTLISSNDHPNRNALYLLNSKSNPGTCMLSWHQIQHMFVRLFTNWAIRSGLIHQTSVTCDHQCRHHCCIWSPNSKLCTCHQIQSVQTDSLTFNRNSNCCSIHLTDSKISKVPLNCSLGRTFLTTGLLLCISLAICLPQVWTYHLTQFELRIETNSHTSINTYPVWRLFNRAGQALYEYSFAAISFVIPSCTLLVGLILIGFRMFKTKSLIQNFYVHESITQNYHVPQLYQNLMNHCVAGLIRDSMLVFWLGLIQACCTLPYFMTSSVHRLGCLLTITQNNMNQDQPLDEELSISWPGRFNWLIIEVNLLFGDFLAQLTLLTMRIFEPLCFPLPETDLPDTLISEPNKTVIRCPTNRVCQTDAKQDLPKAKKKQIKFEDHCNLQDYTDEEDDDEVEYRENEDVEEPAECIQRSKTPSDSGQTSNNISPLPASHAISDVLLSPKFRQRGLTYSMNGTPTSPITTPLLSRIPEFGKYAESNSITMKTSLNSYVEPQTNMVSLTYSPRSRHPCRIQMTSRFVSQTNSKTSSHLMSPKSVRKFPPSNHGINESPPPLPAPPKHLIQMLGDSSIYCTPHGSPQAFYQHKQMNYAIQYSPDLNRPSYASNRHDSPAAFSFRQTDSGVTGLNGSVMESEPFEVDTIMT